MAHRFTGLFFLTAIIISSAILSSCSKDDNSEPTGGFEQISGAEGIYLHLEYEYGVGGFISAVYRPYLLFEDGKIYKNMQTSIDKLDITKSTEQEPENWGSWEKAGDEFVITWRDGEIDTWEDDMWFVAGKAAEGEQINGRFLSVSGGGDIAFGGDVLTFSTSNISFEGEKFTYESTTAGSTSTGTAYASQEKAGTYHLDGHVITLRFNNGAEEKKFFYFYPDSKEVIGIGSDYYIIR